MATSGTASVFDFRGSLAAPFRSCRSHRAGSAVNRVRAPAKAMSKDCNGSMDDNDTANGDISIDRRSLLAGAAAMTSTMGMSYPWTLPAQATFGLLGPPATPGELQPEIYGDEETIKEVYDKSRKALEDALETKGSGIPYLGGQFLRAAFHDAGTFNLVKGKYGANGSLQFEADLDKNRGLAPGINYLAQLKEDLNKVGVPITMADLIQLAGAVATEHAGGPKIPVEIGRRDARFAESVEQLPPETLSPEELKTLFLSNGYTIQELVALSGSHTIGLSRAHQKPGKMDESPKDFDNNYYKRLLEGGGNFPTDRLLATDLDTKPWVEKYAKDEAAFFQDFSDAYIKMGKKGCNGRGTYGPRQVRGGGILDLLRNQ